MRYYETERERIDYFREEYEFLSNFYPVCVRFDSVLYYSVEAAYQAQKCANDDDKKQFDKLRASEAKRIGGKVEIRQDWEQVRLSVMEEIVRAKFTQNPHLAEFLVKTGDKEIIEGNRWGDLYWGVSLRTGEGENHLGKILMRLRAEFAENGIPDKTDTNRRVFGPVAGICVEFGDITQSDCECIVNAANNTLLGGGGVDGAIHRVAGRELMEECRTLNGCNTGEAKITNGYGLKAKYVIHTVGPHYREENDEALLMQSYENSMKLAKEYGIHSIAFPAISTGKFCYPYKEATRIAVETVSEWMSENRDYEISVVFMCVEPHIYDCFCENIEKLRL